MRALVAAALGVALAAALATASAPEAASVRSPTLALTAKAPLKLRGSHFRSRESVRVTVAYGAVRRAKTVRAGATGAFTVTFSAIVVTRPCDLEAWARGASGAKARYALPERMCPID